MEINKNSVVQVFNFNGLQLRALLIESEPWFVGADVARALEYRTASDMFRGVDDEDKGYAKVRTPGGEQKMITVNESGLYTAIVRANTDRAKPFRRWVTAEVLPAIRKTGSYETPKSLEERSLALIGELTARVEEQRRALEIAAPKAAAYDDFMGATGLFSVKKSADLLSEAGIKIGRNQLFDRLNRLGWIYREGGAWVPKEAYKKQGLITAKAQTRPDYASIIPGVRKVADPKIHLTPKGLHKLRELMLPPLVVSYEEVA